MCKRRAKECAREEQKGVQEKSRGGESLKIQEFKDETYSLCTLTIAIVCAGVLEKSKMSTVIEADPTSPNKLFRFLTSNNLNWKHSRV